MKFRTLVSVARDGAIGDGGVEGVEVERRRLDAGVGGAGE